MATPDPRELQKLLKQLQDIEKSIADISGKPVKINFEGKSPDDLAKEFDSVEGAVSAVKVALRNSSKELNNLFDGSGDFYDLTRNIREEFTRLPTALTETRKSFRKIQGFAQKLTEISADILSYNKQDVEVLRKKTELEYARAAAQSEGLAKQLKEETDVYNNQEKAFINAQGLTEKQKQNAIVQLEKQEAIVDELKAAYAASVQQQVSVEKANEAYDKVANRLKEINKAAGISTSALSGLGKAFEKIGFKGLASHFEKGSAAARDYANKATEEGKKSLSGIQGIGVNLTSLFKGAAATIKSAFGALLSPQGLLLGAIGMMAKAFKHVDHAVADTGKNLGLARESAAQMVYEIKSAAAASGDTFLNMDRMLEAQTNISDQLGTNVMLTGEQLGNQSRLAELVGLQGEELANVYTSTLLTGQSQEQLYDSVVSTNDSIFASNQLFKEAAGVTGQIALNLGNNPATIAKAVAETKRLGISLENARDMAMGTLDFENSIQKELEAQVLTGKAINLNRARELAFAGDFEGAAGEMLKQVGGINEFQNMNVIAQQSLAEAMGMTVDQLSDMLVARERSERIEARQLELQRQGLAPEEARLKALRENQTISERLSNAFAKISDIVGGLVAPLVEGVAQSLEKALTFTETLFGATKGTGDKAGELSAHVLAAQNSALKLKENFSGVIDFIKSIGSGLKSAFDSSPILTTLGTIAGGAFAVKGLGKVKDALGFGKLGASAANPMIVKMADGFKGMVSGFKDIFTKGGKGKGGFMSKMMGNFKMPKLGGLSKGGLLKGAGKMLGGLGRVAGKAFLPLQAAMSIYDGFQGFNADKTASLGDKLKNTFSSVVNGLTFGLAGKSPEEIAAEAKQKVPIAAPGAPQTTPQTTPQTLPQEVEAKDVTIRTLPEDTLAFAGGTQFGKETNDLLRQLIAAVNQGGDVIMDGNKVGSTLSLASYKL